MLANHIKIQNHVLNVAVEATLVNLYKVNDCFHGWCRELRWNYNYNYNIYKSVVYICESWCFHV